MIKVFERQLGANKREQCIGTPDYLLDCVDKVFPAGWCDPCPAHPPSTAPATWRAKDVYGSMFVNPPFEDLKIWLQGGRVVHETLGAKALYLVPFRSRRTWFCEAVSGYPVAFLKPVKFHGYKEQFPENCVIVGFGVDPACLEAAFGPYLTHFQERF